MRVLRKAELIIVDDCSPTWDEEVRAIPEDMMNVNIIHHIKNRGLGAARNTGFNYCTGEWVWFIDSDDEVNVGSMIILQKYLKLNGIDILQIGARYHTLDNETLPMYFNLSECEEVFVAPKDILRFRNIVPPCIWSKIYRRSFIRDNNLKNPEGVLYEDQEVLVRTFMAKAKIRAIPLVMYEYYENENSIMNSTWDYRHVFDAYKVVKICKRLLSSYPKELTEDRFKEYEITLSKAKESKKNLSLIEKLKLAYQLSKI